MYRDALFLLWIAIVFVSIPRVISDFVSQDVSKNFTSPDQYIKVDDYQITSTKIEDYPYIVQVTKEGTLFLCFGSLISDVHILTSAYCLRRLDDFREHLEPYEIRVKLGSSVIPLFEVGVKVKEIIEHPKYQYIDGQISNEWPLYDAAILTLEEPAQFSKKVWPIEIASSEDTDQFNSLSNSNLQCDTFVWNTMDTADPTDMNIDMISVKLMQHSDCKKTFLPADSMMEVCAYISDNEHLPCSRNIGAPLVCNNKLFGLHLKKKDCSAIPELFATIEPLKDFIIESTGDDEGILK